MKFYASYLEKQGVAIFFIVEIWIFKVIILREVIFFAFIIVLANLNKVGTNIFNRKLIKIV